MTNSAQRSKLDRLAKINNWSIESILNQPGTIDRFDSDARDFCSIHRHSLEPQLLQYAIDRDAKYKLEAGILLLEMGAASGSPLVLNALSDQDPNIVGDALSFLGHTRLQIDIGLLVPLDQPAAAEALRPLLAAVDPRVRRAAAEALCRLLALDRVQDLRPLLADEDKSVRQVAIYHMSLYHGDAITWPLLRDLFFTVAPEERYWIIQCLAGFSACSDGAIKGEVAAFTHQRLTEILHLQDNDAANEAFNLLHVLKKLRAPNERFVLEEVAASALAPWIKADAIERLVKQDGVSSWESRLLTLLDDPTMAGSIYPIIARMGMPANTPAIADRLRADLRSAATYERLITIAEAFIATGLGDDAALANVVERLESRHRFEIVTRRDHVTAEMMLEHLDRADLLVDVENDVVARFPNEWLDTSRYSALLRIIGSGKRFYFFDCKGFGMRFSYTALLAELFALGEMDIENDQIIIADAPDGHYHLTVNVGPQPILIELKNRGRWFDLDSVLAGLNKLLLTLWPSLQYYAVAATDQYAMVILANAKAMEFMISEFAFPIETPWGA